MTHIDSLRTFCLAAELESFSAAGRQLSLPRATISHRIVQLETSIGVRLFKRSTRKIQLTHEGQTLYSAAKTSLELLDKAIDTVNQREALSGRVRVSIPSLMPDALFTSWVAHFSNEYPLVKIDIVASDTVSDFILDNVDLAIRGRKVESDSVVCRHWRSIPMVLVATPDLAECYQPDTHAILDPLSMLPKQEIEPNISSSDILTSLQLCLLGSAVTFLPTPVVESHLSRRELVSIQSPYSQTTLDKYLVYEAWPLLSPATRALVLFLQEKMALHQAGSENH